MMIRLERVLFAVCAAAAFVGAPAGWAQTPPVASAPAPPLVEDEGVEVSEVVVTARRPGRDPSRATTACLWAHLPEDQRAALTRTADAALRTLAEHDNVPLNNLALTNAAVGSALVACGGFDRPEHLPFARVGLAAYAAEMAVTSALARDRVTEAKLHGAWRTLSPRQQEALLIAAPNPEETPEDIGLLTSALFKVLRAVRPLQAWNPAAYRNGGTNHRVVYFYEAYSVRTAMERRF